MTTMKTVCKIGLATWAMLGRSLNTPWLSLTSAAHARTDTLHGGAEVVGGDVEALELVLYCSLQVKMLSQNKLQRSCQGFCMPLRMPLL